MHASIRSLKEVGLMTASVIVGTLFVVAFVEASTTISTNISTEGTLGVTGLSTLTAGFVSQASSTVVGAFTTTGAAAFGTTLSVTGASTLTGTATFGGLASSTTLKVGSDNVSTVSGIVFGFCSADITATASTTAYTDCTGATGVTSSYKVFIQATSSMPAQVVVQAASSTATTGTIQLRILNTGITGGDTSGSVSVNFWAVR